MTLIAMIACMVAVPNLLGIAAQAVGQRLATDPVSALLLPLVLAAGLTVGVLARTAIHMTFMVAFGARHAGPTGAG